jgi:ornithine decarboxylase
LRAAHDAGLSTGVSFHVGSQQRDIEAWDRALVLVARMFDELRALGIEPQIVNIGGGFPGTYAQDAPPIARYGERITSMLRARLGERLPFVIAEPGRYLVADAGVLQTEVMLVARKSEDDDRRWVYLDVGMFGGLAETMGEAIRYRIRTPHDGGPVEPAVLAGPTCDSVDVLYEHDPYPLPLALAEGDRVEFLSAGAYTTTYASVGFNGFPPLAAVYLPSR